MDFNRAVEIGRAAEMSQEQARNIQNETTVNAINNTSKSTKPN